MVFGGRVNEHAGQSYRRGGPGETGAEAATAPGSQGRLSQAERGLTGTAEAVKIATLVVAPLVCALGALGGIGSFATVRHLAVPWFGTWAWIVPVGIDTGILALLAWDLLAEYLRLSWPVLRCTAWTFIAATTYLNIAAAHGNPTASVMHAAMPVLFVTVIEGIRHLIRQITGLATGTRIERIPLSRWLLAPRTTFLLGRRMVLWHVTSYRDGLHLEYSGSSPCRASSRTTADGCGAGGHRSGTAWPSGSPSRPQAARKRPPQIQPFRTASQNQSPACWRSCRGSA
jgi:Protein of unknown function (DUF2637)